VGVGANRHQHLNRGCFAGDIGDDVAPDGGRRHDEREVVTVVGYLRPGAGRDEQEERTEDGTTGETPIPRMRMIPDVR
jgi:hypothetical protein